MKRHLIKGKFLFLMIIASSSFLNAQNPISPPGIYLADPSARIWDSTLYLYTSTDISCDQWCSWKHDILYTKDVKNWKIASDVFSSKGKNDQVPYNDKLLFAPDCEKKGDDYILYYCQPDPHNALGTAISDKPTGPFKNGEILVTEKKYSQIDPGVFIDDDGTPYLVWGQATLKVAKLKQDTRTIDSSTIKDNVLTREEHFFHEGAYMLKIKGTYYLIYADESRKKMPTCIGYATSDKPFGPYEYKGVIVDNSGCNPGNWNNHGSIINFNDQWYVFYHRSTHGCRTLRKSCLEKISFTPDGSIPEVEMTSQGALPPLDAYGKIEAEIACKMHGNVRIVKESESNEKLSEMIHGDQASYKYLNFNQKPNKITVRYKASKDGKLLLYTNKPWEKKIIGEGSLQSTADSQWKEISFPIKQTEGISELIIELACENDGVFEVDWLKFSK